MTATTNNIMNLFFILFSVSFMHNIYNNKHLLYKFLDLVNDKYWLGSLILIIIWSCYVLYFKNNLYLYKDENQYDAEIATKHAIVAFLIAFCHHMEMTIWVFWVIWMFSFQLEGWEV